MKNKKIYKYSLLLVMLFSWTACAGDLSTDTQENTLTQDFIASKENVKFLGRAFFQKDVLWMAHSSTGAEFEISAKKLEVTFVGDGNANSRNEDGSPRLVVFVNGQRMLDEMLYKRKETFTVFDGNKEVKGLVQIIKVSESANGIAGIQKITLDSQGKISPAPERDLKIEFIGDSITCGYGVDATSKNSPFSTKTEDNTKTYAYKTAKALNADYSMVSISGWGIISGYSGDGTKKADSVLPKYYDKVGFSWGGYVNGIVPQQIDWEFKNFESDFIVVNLGTNDNSYVKGDSKKTREYIDGYIKFLYQIREKNPNSYIICSLGIMGRDLCPAVEKAVEEYKSACGDSKVSALRFNDQLASDGYGADWHPSEKTHEKAGKLLTEKIKELQ